MSFYDVIVIGGGAAGLMCALTAGRRGRRVLLLEKADKVGKKILISGGGRCNFTNLNIEPDHFISANPHFCKSALSRYTQWDFIGLLQKHGVKYHEKKVDGRPTGQLFCDDSAQQVVSLLLKECELSSVQLRTNCEIKTISHQQHFCLQTSQGKFSADSLVVATGGLSIPKMGASAYGYQIAEQFGLHVLPQRAGLVPFTFTDKFKEVTSSLTGVSIRACMRSPSKAFTDYVLFTHRGLSGPAVLQLSSYWLVGEDISMNLLPEHDDHALLKDWQSCHAKALMRTVLARELPKKLVLYLESDWWPEYKEMPLGQWPNLVLESVAAKLSNWLVKPAGTEGYRKAEVTLGGVDTNELSSKTMESKKQPGLFFIGEVVDVTGQLGGYNFQWAWSSGYAAGQYA